MHKRYHQYNDTYVEVFYEPELVNGKRERQLLWNYDELLRSLMWLKHTALLNDQVVIISGSGVGKGVKIF